MPKLRRKSQTQRQAFNSDAQAVKRNRNSEAVPCTPNAIASSQDPCAGIPPSCSIQPSLQTVNLSLSAAARLGNNLFTSLANGTSNQEEIVSMNLLVSFMRQGFRHNAEAMSRTILKMPERVANFYTPILTTPDGNCFYNAISLLICGKEVLSCGLRAIVAHHMDINEDFLDNIPYGIRYTTTKTLVLTLGNYAEILEVIIMSYVLRVNINVYGNQVAGQLRVSPCRSQSDINLYLHRQHYSALLKKENGTPTVPDVFIGLPSIETFVFCNANNVQSDSLTMDMTSQSHTHLSESDNPKNTREEVRLEKLKENQEIRLRTRSKRSLQRARVRTCQNERLTSSENRQEHKARQKSSQNKRLSFSRNRQEHNARLKLNQNERLASIDKWQEHCARQKNCQEKRLASNEKRQEHCARQKKSQVHRLAFPKKRLEHCARLKKNQQNRLASPKKRLEHCARLKKNQQNRLASPKKRQEHCDRQKICQKRRLLSPRRREEHRFRDKILHRAELQTLRKRMIHNMRQSVSQKKRLCDPDARKAHLERLRQGQIKRMGNSLKRKKHLKRLKNAQAKRLEDPVGRIIHISRVLASKVSNESRKELSYRKKLFHNFLIEKKQGPTHACHSCHRLWFKTSIKQSSVLNLDMDTLRGACGQVEGDTVALCATCYRSIKRSIVPKLSLENKDLCFPIIPEDILALTELEERFICPRIPFMSIRAAVIDQQYLVKGRAVNVPIEVSTSVQILPRAVHETSVVPICFRRKKSYKSHVAFENVRPHLINKAVELLEHSPVYRHFNITVDMQGLGDGTFLPSSDVPAAPIEDDNEEYLEEEEPVNIADDETLLANAIVFAPGEGRKPESLFSDYVEAQSFMKVYGGQLIQQPRGISYQQWIKSEIMRDDRRCAYVTKLFFSALKLRVSKMSSSISFCLRKAKSKKTTFTAQNLLNENVVKEIEMHDSGFRVFSSDRGAPAYWESKKRELFAQMRQLGPPTLFVTLSPAETRWPELIVILKHVVDGENITEDMVRLITYQEKVRLVKTDPVTVARYFEYRMRRLFNLLKQDCSVFREHNVIDYYVRTEFQQRGSPHLHCLLWLKNAPSYSESSDNKEVIEFIDRFITCSSLISPDSLNLQTHNHTFTCKKGVKQAGKKCRFDIPFFPVVETVILSPLLEEDVSNEEQSKMRKARNAIQERLMELRKNQEVKTISEILEEFSLDYDKYINIIRSGLKRVTVFLKRAPYDCMINFYNADLLLLHEANMDIQYITDMYACATYILNYLNKSNSGMSKLLREAAAEIRLGNFSMKEQLRMLGNSFLNASEFSAQEAVYYIMGLPLSSCSRQCQFINTSQPEKRVAVVKRKEDLEKLPPESTDIFVKDVLDHYAQRPNELENDCLADFVALYNFSTKLKGSKNNENDDEEGHDSINDIEENQTNFQLLDKSGYLRRRGKAKIIRFVNYSEHDADFVRENVMLFYPWRNELDMIATADNIYESKLAQITEHRAKYVFNEKIIDILNDAQVRLADINNESQGETYSPQNLMVFDAEDSQISKLPDKDIDKVTGAASEDANTDDVILPIPKMLSEEEYSTIVSTLNLKQHILLMHVLHMFKEGRLPFYHCVLGGAGVGKSRVINAIHQTILRWLNRSITSAEQDTLKVLLCAPTGKAAFGIKGTTLHSTFALPLNQCAVDLKPLGSAARNTMWSKMRDVKLIIIDEISMVGSKIFQQVDCRLKQIFKTSEPFAGISIIVLGDFNQLSPVGDRYIFQSHISSTYGDIIGNPLWELFTSYTLIEIMRQRDDADFALALNNLARGELEDDQVKLFQSRVWRPGNNPIPAEAIRLFRSNQDVDSFNNKIISDDVNKILVEADDKVTGQPNDNVKNSLLKAARRLTKKDSQLPFYLALSIGIKYMVTINVDVEDGLVNGAVGILKQIDVAPDSSVTRLWLLFPHDVGKKRRQEVRHETNLKLTAIDRVVRTIKPCKSQHSVMRKQFPLVPAEAMTIYKSQGGTYNHVAVNITKGLRRTELYVALSRCTKLSGLHLVGDFSAPCAPEADDKVVVEMRRIEKKQIGISCLTPSMFMDEITIVYHNVQSLKKNTHWADFKNFMKLHQPTIYIVAETWTKENDDLQMDGYIKLHHVACSGQRYAYGLIIYVKQNITARVAYTYSNENNGEKCCLATVIFEDIAIFTGYKPPTTPYHKAKNAIQTAIDIAQNSGQRWLCIGDFNLDVSNVPQHYFFKELGNRGFLNQLLTGTSTTNENTAIDCAWANFNHTCGVIETFYSYHKALLCVPNKSRTPVEMDKTTSNQISHANEVNSLSKDAINFKIMSLEEAAYHGKVLKGSITAKVDLTARDKKLVESLICFVRKGINNSCRKIARLQLPSHLKEIFQPVGTHSETNSFYNAISMLLCGKVSLVKCLQTLIAYHIDINKTYIDALPEQYRVLFGRQFALMDLKWVSKGEILIMSHILRKPINIMDSQALEKSCRYFPCSSSNELYLYDFKGNYTALLVKPNQTPPIPNVDPNLEITQDVEFNTCD